jgi:hypothetical protein
MAEAGARRDLGRLADDEGDHPSEGEPFASCDACGLSFAFYSQEA